MSDKKTESTRTKALAARQVDPKGQNQFTPKVSPKGTRYLRGRLREEMDSAMTQATASVDYDRVLALVDIQGSLAHAKMLARTGIIPDEDYYAIARGLRIIRQQIQESKFRFSASLEDVHMNIEKALIDLVGDAGARLHTARSRNDQVVTDEMLFLREAAIQQRLELISLREALVQRAEEAGVALIPGYTHLQRAHPVLLAHHLLAYQEMLSRDQGRLESLMGRLSFLPLGSGALAGTSLPIDPFSVAYELGFQAPAANSLDAVSSRDFLLEYLSFAAILGTHLSRLAEELVLWSTQEFGFVSFPDTLSTTSSMLPQKKNPDGAELLRGKSGRLIGNLVSLLVVVKGLPLSYNRDLQEDKEPWLDTLNTLDLTLPLAKALILGVSFNYLKMGEAASDPFLGSTDLAEHLVQNGVPFRDAHRAVGEMVAYCLETGKIFENLSRSEIKKFCPQADPEFLKKMEARHLVERKTPTPGSTATQSVLARLAEARVRLANDRSQGVWDLYHPTELEKNPKNGDISAESPEPVKTEPVKTETAKAEPGKTETAKAEPGKKEPAKTEPVKSPKRP
ncbi:MAG: argininosuccinate lyase [Deltaproteobacteria bacterium]|jgi:argininosuccinate lyase|nr:argininosuccinate lyase [Deltaproteobacteria bacterium]